MNNIAPDSVQLFRKIVNRGFCRGDLSLADECFVTKLSEPEYLARRTVVAAEFHGTRTGAGGPFRQPANALGPTMSYVIELDGDKISHMTKVSNDLQALRVLA